MKKKVIIFTCTGGHTIAAQALNEYLAADYQVEIVNVFTDALLPIDLVSKLTFGKYNSQDLYNGLLRRRWYKFTNTWLLRGYKYYQWRSARVAKLINAAISQRHPDLVISVIPLFNQHILSSCQAQNIPFLLIPTDIDVTTFFYGINKPSYPKFHIGLMVDNVHSRTTVEQLEIPQSAIHIIGPVLRTSFFEKSNKDELKREFGIKPDTAVILLAMGSQGSVSTYDFCVEIAKYGTKPLHLLVASGNNGAGCAQLRTIPFPPGIKITAFEYTNRMADLIKMADIFITKSGGMSIMEGLALDKMMILDATSEILVWERLNQEIVFSFGKGVSLNDVKYLPMTIDHMLARLAQKEKISTSHPSVDTISIIKKLVKELI